MSFMGNMIGNKALAAHGKNEYEKALQLYNEAYEKGMDKPRLLRGYSVLLPGLTPAEKTDLHVNYAIILSQKGHLDRAMDILEDEFRHLKNGTMYSIIGYLKVEQGDAEAALAFNREALDYDDADPVFLDNMGQTYYRLVGDKETAKTYFDKAIALKPTAIDTNYFLSLYDIEAGNREKAVKRLQTARGGFFSPLNYATPEMIDEKLAELGAK